MTAIKPKNKPCTICGKDDKPWFSHKRCKTCTQKSCTKPKQAGIKNGVYKPTGERSLMLDLFHAGNIRCFITGQHIAEFNVSNWAHVLSKKGYREFRLERRNIVPMVLQAHYLYDFGTEEQRQKFGYHERWEALYKLKSELQEEYKTLHGQNIYA